MSTGSIEFGQAKLVYEKDTYENVGIDKPPIHKSNTFGDRGNLVGVYCVVRTNTGAYLTEEMTIDEVNQIKNRSESAKKGNGPWITDYSCCFMERFNLGLFQSCYQVQQIQVTVPSDRRQSVSASL